MVERLYHHLTTSEYSNKETSFSVDTYQLQCVLKLFWQLVKTLLSVSFQQIQIFDRIWIGFIKRHTNMAEVYRNASFP